MIDDQPDSVGELIADKNFGLATTHSHCKILPEYEPEQPWLSYLQEIEDIIDEDDIQNYTAVIKDLHWILVKFDNVEFLQGVMAVCNWLNKDWRSIIRHLHFKQDPIDVNTLSVS